MLADAMKFSGIPEGLVRRIAWTIDDLSWGFEFNETFDLEKDISFRLGRAGHILGSSLHPLPGPQQRFVGALFRGSRRSDTPILVDPEAPQTADLVVMESTYGDRLHEPRDQRVGSWATSLPGHWPTAARCSSRPFPWGAPRN
jgi:metallo-beta-lactamase family protein